MSVFAPVRESDMWFVGEKKELDYDVTQSDGTTPQTMTGWALKWTLYDKRGGSAQFTAKTTTSGITIGDGSGTDDRAAVTVDAADTTGLTAGAYFAVLERTDSGSEAILAHGDVLLQAA